MMYDDDSYSIMVYCCSMIDFIISKGIKLEKDACYIMAFKEIVWIMIVIDN